MTASPVSTGNRRAIDIGIAGRDNAYVSIASSGSFVGVAWGPRTEEGVTDVYTALSRDGGKSFAAPARVNQVPGDASVSGEQPPRIALVARAAGDPSVVVMWTAKASAGTRLVSARANDVANRLSLLQRSQGVKRVAIAFGSRWPSLRGESSSPFGWTTVRWLQGRLAEAQPEDISTEI
jgi:hypothetical protein